MHKYKTIIPYSTGFKAKSSVQAQTADYSLTQTSDLFLYALFARVALTNNDTIEFETTYDKTTDTIELIVPDGSLELFNQVTGMKRGPNFQAYINWLIGSATLQSSESAKDASFVSASAIDTWFGATRSTINGRFILNLPTAEASVVGYNLKTNATFSGRIKVLLMWMFIGGSNTSFDIRATTNISDTEGNSPITVINDTNISTVNLIEGDIRETEIIDSGNIVGNNNIVSLLINRNFVGSSDNMTEAIGIVGLRLQLI